VPSFLNIIYPPVVWPYWCPNTVVNILFPGTPIRCSSIALEVLILFENIEGRCQGISVTLYFGGLCKFVVCFKF